MFGVDQSPLLHPHGLSGKENLPLKIIVDFETSLKLEDICELLLCRALPFSVVCCMSSEG